VLLTRLPPSTVSGTVRSSEAGNPLAEDVLLELVDVSTGNVVATTTSAGTVNGIPVRNFSFTGILPGTYVVRASRNGFVAKTTSQFTVLPGRDVSNIAIVLDPEHTFGAGLQLISIPYDLPGVRAATVLNQPEDTFKSAYWITPQNRYAIYPEPEAQEFRLGKGMFVRFTSPTAFTFNGGTPAPNTVFRLPVKTGWNLIGNPRKVRIDWLKVKVATSAGTLSMQQAMDQGIILNGLFRYADGYIRTDFLDPWVGYYMKAFQDVTLLIPVDNTSASASPGVQGRMALRPAPSVEQVAAELAAQGLGPAGVPAPAARPRSNGTNGTQVNKQSSALLPAGSPFVGLLGWPGRLENPIRHWPWHRSAGRGV